MDKQKILESTFVTQIIHDACEIFTPKFNFLTKAYWKFSYCHAQ